MSKTADEKAVSAFTADVTTSINQAGLEDSFARSQGDANLHEHQMVMGKTRDGMGGVFRAHGPNGSRATGLLASLMRRI